MRASLVALGCPESRLHVVRLAKDMGAYPFSARSGPVRSLVSVGRLVEKKGHLDAIRAVQLVARSGLPLHLRLVGEGPLRGEIEAFVRAERLETAVTLCGALPHPEVRREMAAANAFVLCSRTARDGDREGTPTVLLEAQALGLPVVSTRHAGIPEIVPVANHWLLAEEGDVAGIAAVLQRLAACGPEELRAVQQAGRAHVEAHHALPESVRQLRDVYAAVAGAAVHA